MRAVRPGAPERVRDSRTTTGRAASTTLGRSRSASGRSGTVDSQFDTGTRGLTNARTRIVGNRTGFLADAVIATVRFFAAARGVVARAFSRAAAVITPLGWALAALAPVALVLGYVLGLVELVVIGFACVVLIVIAVIYLVGRNSIVIELTVPHSRVVVGEPATGQLDVTNPSRRRTIGVTVEIPIGDGLIEVVLPGLRRGATFSHQFAIPTTRRGVVPVGPARTVRADPVGLVRRELVWTGVTELFVHPRTIGIPSMSTGFIRDLEGNPTRDLSASDVSFHALREYLPGTSAVTSTGARPLAPVASWCASSRRPVVATS